MSFINVICIKYNTIEYDDRDSFLGSSVFSQRLEIILLNFNQNTFCMLITFHNSFKASFLDKKFTVTMLTLKTEYFLLKVVLKG